MHCEIILVQHALTQWNIDGRRQGHTDTPLNETGRRMAQILAERLKDEKIEAIYTSDLLRAYETAMPISAAKKVKITQDKRLREGRWKNQEWASEYPVLPFDVEYEESEDVYRRTIEVMNEIAQKHMEESVLVITHGGIINRFIQYVQDSTREKLPKYKKIRTAVNRFIYEKGKWKCIILNDDKHLDKIKDNGLRSDHG